jgi:hypothetical protein
MKKLTYITSVILIIFGMILMLGGLTLGAAGIVRAGSRTQGSTPPRPGLRLAGEGLFGSPGGLILPAFVLIQGLMIVAMGEGLYLLADLSGKSAQPPA